MGEGIKDHSTTLHLLEVIGPPPGRKVEETAQPPPDAPDIGHSEVGLVSCCADITLWRERARERDG